RFLLSALEAFADDVTAHMSGGCGRKVRGVLPVPGIADVVSEDSGMALSVDWSRCAGHGLCGHMLPDLIKLDMFGYPVLAGQAVPGRVPGERVHQGLAAGAVDDPHAAQVPVVAAGLDERGERELVQAGGAAVGEPLLRGDRAGERGRAEHPPEPDRGRQRL